MEKERQEVAQRLHGTPFFGLSNEDIGQAIKNLRKEAKAMFQQP